MSEPLHHADIRLRDIGVAGNKARLKKHAAVQAHYKEFTREMTANLRSTEPTFVKTSWRDNGRDVLISFHFTDAAIAERFGAEANAAWGKAA